MLLKLTPETVLRRAPGLVLHLELDGDVRVWLGDHGVRGGPHSLAVLDAFRQPISFGEAFRGLVSRAAKPEDSVDLTRTIFRFCEAGILVRESDEPARAAAPSAFEEPTAHVAMLNDHARTSAFLEAIRRVVRPDDAVLDLGTGSGVLATGAARAGARHVYAIEARDIARTARSVFAANGVSDRVTLLEGWSTEVTIPERADVLVSEILGNELLSERAVETIADARRRLLKPDARIIPGAARLVALLVAVPREYRDQGAPTEDALREWRSRYGIDFGPLASTARQSSRRSFVNPCECRDWPALTAPLPLVEIDFRTVEGSRHEGSATAVALGRGTIDGVLVYTEVDLAPGVELSLSPTRATPSNHWRNPLWLLGEPLAVEEGDVLSVSYGFGGPRASVSVRRA